MLSRGLVRTGVPGWYIRLDDGTFEQLNDAKHFLRRGIPVTFALNSGSIGSGSRFSWADLRHLIGFAKKHGTEISVLQHGKTNWSKYLVGDPAVYSNFNYDSYTWQDFLDEVDPSEIEAQTGLVVSGYVQPGDVNPNIFCRYNKELIVKALKTVGLNWANGLNMISNADGTEGENGSLFSNTSMFALNPASSIGNLHQQNELRPGNLRDPYSIPSAYTVDLGSTVVVRGRKLGGGGVPTVDPNSGADGWLLGEDNNGAGAEGSWASDITRTIQFRIAQSLGVGGWNCLTMHGQERTHAQDVALSTGTQVYPRHFSSKHVAWLMAALRDAGHLRMLTVEDWIGELWSDFEEGTDLIANPSVSIPMLDVGEVQLPDMIVPRGMCSRLFGQNSLIAGMNFLDGAHAYDADQRLVTNANLIEVSTLIGPNCPRLPRSGMRGGWLLHPDEDDASHVLSHMQFPHLPPGLYKFDVELFMEVGGGGRLVMNDYGVTASRQMFDAEAMMLDEETKKASSLPQFCVLDGTSVRRQLDVSAKPTRLSLLIDCNPARCFPQVMLDSAQDPGSVADAASFAMAPFAVVGARLGAQVKVRSSAEIPDGVSIDGVVTGNDSVTVTIYNNSGVAFAPGAATWYLYVEDLRDSWLEGVKLAPASPWSFCLTMQFSKDGSTEVRCAEPELVLIRRY